MVAAVLLAAGSAWKADMTDSVAGLSVGFAGAVPGCFHDPLSGFYVYKTADCDSHWSVILTRDRHLVEERAGVDAPGFGRPSNEHFGQESMPSRLDLATAHGVQIGMSMEKVRKMLGRPDRTWARRPYAATLYRQRLTEGRRKGLVLRNTYVFKSDRLIEIILNLDSVPGCDGHGDSEDGWPWTKF